MLTTLLTKYYPNLFTIFDVDSIIETETNNMEELDKKSNQNVVTQKSASEIHAAKNRKTMLILIGIALLLLLILWIWKAMEIKRLKKDFATSKIELHEKASKEIVSNNETHLKLLAKPMVWALRTEMMQGNLNQVNLYLNDLVKEKNFQSIAIANQEGIIISSTNKKDEEMPFTSISKEEYLASNETNIENEGDSLLIMTSPIMGFNNRLGTLYIKYVIDKPVFE